MTIPSISSPLTIFTDSLLQLGRLIHSKGDAAFRPVSKAGHSPSSSEMDLIQLISAMPETKKLISYNDDVADIIELRVLAVTVYMSLFAEYHPNVRQVSEVIGREFPVDIMRARVAIKTLVQRQVLRFKDGQDKTWNGLIIVTKSTLDILGLLTNDSPIFSEKTLAIQASSKSDGDDQYKNIPKGFIPPFETIYYKIRETVLGDYLEEPIRTMSAMFHTHLHRASLIRRGQHPKTPNIVGLMIGSSSVGKTFLAETAAKVITEACGGEIFPFSSFSASDITAEGYCGCSTEEIVKPLLIQCKWDAVKARFGCSFIDEIDKKACHTDRANLDVGGRAVQEGLLRIIGGSTFPVGGRRSSFDQKTAQFNSDGTMFLFGGAFVGLQELMMQSKGKGMGFNGKESINDRPRLRDCLIEYGFIPEFISRCGSLIILPDPSRADLGNILVARGGALSCYGKLWEGMGLEVFLAPGGVRAISDYGITTRSFARGMHAILNRITEQLAADGAVGTIRLEKRDISRIIDSMGSG